MKILILEDDFSLAKEMQSFFEKREFDCDVVYDGLLFMRQFKQAAYDLVVLDVNVPGQNGFQVCQAIRVENKQVAILMLTAFGEIEDKVMAFDNGADDYLVKPFHFEELLARIKSLLRRKDIPQNKSEIISIEDLVINISEMKVFRSGIEISLTPKEFKLLIILAKANGRVVTKQYIADELWDYHIETNQNTIEVYINFLRKKLEKEFDTKLIHTKIGYGYYLKASN